MVICLERGAALHMAQLMPLPLTLSCFSKIQIGFTFLVPAHLGSLGKRAVKQMCVCASRKCDGKIVSTVLLFSPKCSTIYPSVERIFSRFHMSSRYNNLPNEGTIKFFGTIWGNFPRHTTQPLLTASSPHDRSISPFCWAHSSKPAAVACSGHDGMDGQMDTRQFHRPCSALWAVI